MCLKLIKYLHSKIHSFFFYITFIYIYKRLFEEAEGSRIGGALFMEIQKLGSCKPVY